MPKSVFITQKIPDHGVQILKEKGYVVDMYHGDHIPPQDELISLLKQHPYDAVMCMLTDTIDSTVFDATPSAKMFASYTVGFNNIDIEEAKKRGIAISNAAGSSNMAVAEHTIALMIGLTTRMVEGDRFTRSGQYKGWTPMAFIGTDLSQKVIGLVGTGAIGTEVAHMAQRGFKAHIIYFDLIQNENLEKEYNATRCATLEELLQKADIVSLHIPLLKSTQHLMNVQTFRLMKSSAFLINTSRGPVIDEKALVDALKNKVISGAGIDVYENEPSITSGLTDLSNVILTPHIASARESTRNEMAEIAAHNIIDFFEGKIPRNKVN